MQKVNEILTSDNSLFSIFSAKQGDLYEKLFETTAPEKLDMMLLVNCGERYASPLLTHYDLNNVVDYIVEKFGFSWQKVKDVLYTEYNPLDPYHRTETTTRTKQVESSTEGNSTQKNGIVGFDSDEPVDSTVDTNTDGSTQQGTETETVTHNITGNNGNVDYHGLITSEIETRRNSFITLVLNDIQHTLTLDIY